MRSAEYCCWDSSELTEILLCRPLYDEVQQNALLHRYLAVALGCAAELWVHNVRPKPKLAAVEHPVQSTDAPPLAFDPAYNVQHYHLEDPRVRARLKLLAQVVLPNAGDKLIVNCPSVLCRLDLISKQPFSRALKAFAVAIDTSTAGGRLVKLRLRVRAMSCGEAWRFFLCRSTDIIRAAAQILCIRQRA